MPPRLSGEREPALRHALDRSRAGLAQEVSPAEPNRSSSAERAFDEAVALAARPLEAEQVDERRLALLAVLAGALAQRFGRGLPVEDVVGDLEGGARARGRRRSSRARSSASAPPTMAPASTEKAGSRRSSSPAAGDVGLVELGRAVAAFRRRSSIWPPTMPPRPEARARPSTRSARTAAPDRSPARPAMSKASVSSASPARMAVASSNALCTVGWPRRRSSSSIAGRSSWTSE